MKKKNLATKLSLSKKTIANLAAVTGGIGETYGCPTGNPTIQAGCTLGICVIKHTDDCPTHPACITEPPTWNCVKA